MALINIHIYVVAIKATSFVGRGRHLKSESNACQ